MRAAKRNFSLQTTIILLVFGVLSLTLFITDLLISERIADNIEQNQAEKSMYIARMIANSDIVINGLANPSVEGEIQTFANKIEKATGVDFIVVMDMKAMRKTHPNKDKIGKRFVGGDEGNVLKGQEYISEAKGTLGVSLRAFTPVWGRDGKQVGAVSVGILLSNVKQEISKGRLSVFMGVGMGGLVGLLCAFFLARKIKRILFGLEPFEIAKLLEERSAMLQSTREGILAVDQHGSITLVNAEAVRLLYQAGMEVERESDLIGRYVGDMIPHSRLLTVLETGQAVLDQEQNLGGVVLLGNNVPIGVDDRIVGAIATFRDKTEIKLLAEQLTGARMYAEALRAQAHEFMNKLHVILGMVQLGFYEKLSSYISDIAYQHQNEVGQIVRMIKEPVVAGFLLGKLSYAREMSVELNLLEESFLPEPSIPETTHELITIIGNLIDNAIDAVQNCTEKWVDLKMVLEDGILAIEVSDSGPGISPERKNDIFLKGISTKGENRGLGLFLVKRSIDSLGGRLELTTEWGKGTTFEVYLPYEEKGGSE